MLREVIREAASNSDFRAVDLGLGDESYKQQYANCAQRTLHFTIEVSRLRLAGEMSRYYVAQALKRSATFEKLARHAIGTVGRVRAKQSRNSAPIQATD
jgi:CelD/BcsL family acetyltransferase involved in cellulose biosynthesis